jgi:GAF domain-containing protein
VEPISHRLTELSRRHLGEYALGVPLELSQVLALVPRLSANALRARTAILRLVDDATGAFDQVFRFEQAPAAELVVAEESLAALTRQETVPILIPDLSQDARFAPQVPARPISALAVPLLQSHALLGTLCLLDKIAATPGEPAAFE